MLSYRQGNAINGSLPSAKESVPVMTPFPPKTPMQMRREKEDGPPRPTPRLTPQQKREIEPKRPPLGGDNDLDEEMAATADWLAHIQAGRIDVR
jgi:hypothetical protein